MRISAFAFAFAAVLSVTPAAVAQYPPGAVGFGITTSLGQTAGWLCNGFSCTPSTITVSAGEVVTLKISGEWHAQFLLGSSATATSCVAVPGVFHNLVLDAPIALMAGGTLGSVSPVLSCPNGYTTLTATVPPGIPSGTQLAIQALTSGAGNVLSLTGAIVVTFV
jgi:hypothetical protein